MRILITNDDGIDSIGIKALEEALAGTGAEVLVAAPDAERSASSHSVSLRQAVKVEERGPGRWAILGTPVDSVNLAVNHLLKDNRPDLVISGINRGANLGCDIHYSGTVGAAREGALLGIPSFAISLESKRDDADFGPSAGFAVRLAGMLHDNHLPPRTLLNANVPDLPESEIKGVRVTVMGVRDYDNSVHEQCSDNGESWFTIGGAPLGGRPIPDSDIVAVKEGWISVTPLTLDQTDEGSMDWLRKRIG